MREDLICPKTKESCVTSAGNYPPHQTQYPEKIADFGKVRLAMILTRCADLVAGLPFSDENGKVMQALSCGAIQLDLEEILSEVLKVG